MANQHFSETYPPTYARGTKCIDYIFGSDWIQTYCKSSGILPLHIGSDHRAIFIRINLQAILSTEIHNFKNYVYTYIRVFPVFSVVSNEIHFVSPVAFSTEGTIASANHHDEKNSISG
jgi:hypothetical protein